MRRCYIVLILFCCYTLGWGQSTYAEDWKKIESLRAEGNRKSVMPYVLKIQDKAMKEKNLVQIIKSLQTEFGLEVMTSEDDSNDLDSKFFKKLKTIEGKLSGKDKVIFHAFAGQFIEEFYQMNNWKINAATPMMNADISTLETWTKPDFKTYLTNYYNELEKDATILKTEKISDYKDIFTAIENETIDHLLTLNDWFVLRHINFLKNQDFFKVKEISANKTKINTLLDGQIKKLSGNPKLFFQLEKLLFNCNGDKCADRLQELQYLYSTVDKTDFKVVIASKILDEYLRNGDYKTAMNFIGVVKSSYPKSKYLPLVLNVENQITEASVTLKMESSAQSGKPIHMAIEHKNVPALNFNIYAISYDDYATKASRYSEFLGEKKKLETKILSLPNSGDYKNHTTSLALDPLSKGVYLMEADFDGKKGQPLFVLVTDFKVLRLVSNNTDEGRCILRDSETGRALPNETIKIMQYEDDGTLLKEKSFTTDSDGSFTFSLKEFAISHAKKLLVQRINSSAVAVLNSDFDNDEDELEENVFSGQLLTDCGIYRPGQIVYYKAIGTQSKNGRDAVVPSAYYTVKLFDANDQVVDQQTMKTNDYGSFSNQFLLPQNVLNGNFRLILYKNDSKQIATRRIRVEEYKRPQFEVQFLPLEAEYQYGQNVSIKGTVKSYSGVPLGKQEVNYQFMKRDIRWRYFGDLYNRYTISELVFGTTTTDEQGNFTITLLLEKEKEELGIQLHNYEVVANVTDVNGETQSGITNFKVASTTHYFKISELENALNNHDLKIKVETFNYSDKKISKPYNIKLVRKSEVDRVIRETFKDRIQDKSSLTKEEFLAKFPHDYYSKDEAYKFKNEIVVEKSQTSSDLNLGKLQPGNYELMVFNKEGNDTIKVVREFSIWDPKKLEPSQKPFLKVVGVKKLYNIGENLEAYVYSAVPNAQVEVFIQDGVAKVQYKVLTLKNGVAKLDVAIPQHTASKKLDLQFRLLAYNSVETFRPDIEVKNPESEIKIETVSFRDRLEPNVKETWKFKMVGSSKTDRQFEVLATMYDASLDKFTNNSFTFKNLQREYYYFQNFDTRDQTSLSWLDKRKPNAVTYDYENFSFKWNVSEYVALYSAMPTVENAVAREVVVTGAMGIKKDKANSAESADAEEQDSATSNTEVSVRKNLNETAFFYPSLYTDDKGEILVEFTTPEALTRWKLMLAAHDKDARFGKLTKEMTTYKQLSVTPNYPRFLREKDEIVFQSKIANISDKALDGEANIQILNALTNEDITKQFIKETTGKSFKLAANSSTVVEWKTTVPTDFSAIIFKVIAQADGFSDGEQKAVPVLPNRMLLTDSQPIVVKEGQTKTFTLESLKNNASSSVTNVATTLELNTNPVWEVIMALPSLKDDDNQSTDVMFNKWFADVIAMQILNKNSRIKAVFDQYKDNGQLTSELMKNEELKQVLLKETPWLMEAQNETEQMQKLARLFDLNTMRFSLKKDLQDWLKLQTYDGGFAWYPGYESSYSTSLYILKQLGKLNQWLGESKKEYYNNNVQTAAQRLIKYVDDYMTRNWKEDKKEVWTDFALNYLDSRQYWEKEFPMTTAGENMKKELLKKSTNFKFSDLTFYGLHRSALLFNAIGAKEASNKVLNYLKETAVTSETKGSYWKNNINQWGWYGVEEVNQAGALEAFNTLTPHDTSFIEDLKIGLMSQKEVQAWSTSRGTAEVIFTLLNSGKSWTTPESDKATITWGNEKIDTDKELTGYIKKQVRTSEIDKGKSSVTIKKDGPGLMQGGLFWQYYEDLDKVKSTETSLSIERQLYKKIPSGTQFELKKITDSEPLKVGDVVTVRMILNTDRTMEFVHLKDQRAAGFEPLVTISKYEWKNGLGYYRETKDAVTNFYIEYLPKGKYVFEYDYVCNAAGKFSNGAAILQNFYAPQMNARSKGLSVEIK